MFSISITKKVCKAYPLVCKNVKILCAAIEVCPKQIFHKIEKLPKYKF